MKKSVLILSCIILLIAFCKVELYSQDSKPTDNVMFIFNSEADFTNNFLDNKNAKIISFKIFGLYSPEQRQEIINQFKLYRGVIDFKINDKLDEGLFEAEITLYNFADHWMYYENLFIRNDIKEITIADEVINCESLSEL